MHIGSVIFVDFDNVFTSLWGRDESLAIRFASDPADWLAELAATDVDVPRRWLVARCYMNPAGNVSAPGEKNDRLWFSKFRGDFVQAGFEVVDCPTLTRGVKNAADIRMVIDALDLLDHRTRFGEFVFVSGDSDFTPLLHRLRAEDRRTAIVSPGHLSTAYSAVAERVLDFDRIEALLNGPDRSTSGPVKTDVAENGSSADEQTFALLIQQRYEKAVVPLNLSTLSQEVLRVLPNAKSSDWFGKGTFRKALDSLSLPNVRFSVHQLWDSERHERPVPPQFAANLPDDIDIMPESGHLN